MEEEIIIIEELDDEEIVIVEDDIERLKPVTQEKEATPTKEKQILTPDDGFTGLSKVTVNPIPDEYIVPTGTIDIDKAGTYDVKDYVEANVEFDMSDATATSGDIASGKTAYTSEGLITGTGVLAPTIEKGLRIDSYDADGYAKEITIIGLTEIPNYYMYYAMNRTTYNKGWAGSGDGCKVNLPKNLTKIGNYAFYNGNYLNIGNSLPETLETIGENAFYGCSLKLGITIIPNSVKTIGNRAFYGVTNWGITQLSENLETLGSSAFYNNTVLSIKTLPPKVTIINSEVFRGCLSSFKELTARGNVTNINANAFYGCTNFGKLAFPNVTAVPTLANSNAFTGTKIASGKGYIYFPDNLVDTAKSSSNWSTYANVILPISQMPTE